MSSPSTTTPSGYPQASRRRRGQHSAWPSWLLRLLWACVWESTSQVCSTDLICSAWSGKSALAFSPMMFDRSASAVFWAMNVQRRATGSRSGVVSRTPSYLPALRFSYSRHRVLDLSEPHHPTSQAGRSQNHRHSRQSQARPAPRQPQRHPHRPPRRQPRPQAGRRHHPR